MKTQYLWFSIAAVVLVLFGGLLFIGITSNEKHEIVSNYRESTSDQDRVSDRNTGAETDRKDILRESDTEKVRGIRRILVNGDNYRFTVNGKENPDIIVNYGERVVIEFKSVGGFHDWVVDEFNARSEKVSEGMITRVEFLANMSGTFEYYCSVGNHRERGMKGKLVVNMK